MRRRFGYVPRGGAKAPPPARPVASGKDPGSADRPLTVGELAARVTALLEQNIGRVSVVGEISNLRIPRSGHAYFVLKDETAAINAVCFKSALARLGIELHDGKKIEVRGKVTAYAPRSEYQIVVDSAREAGQGELMARYIELRDRLKAEGLFEEDRKKPLPALPRRVAVVTSSTGAALRDILDVLSRRAPSLSVDLSACAVQGAAAPGEIVAAIRRIVRHGWADVVIIARGGGSMEDLWSFNDERVVRAIANCPIPVITGVGHETDFTLADFAADRRAPTPSAAAEIVTASYQDIAQKVGQLSRRLERATLGGLERRAGALRLCTESWAMRRPIDALAAAIQRHDDLSQALDEAAQGRLKDLRVEMTELGRRLFAVRPARRLELAQSQLREFNARLRAVRPDRRWLPEIRLRRARVAEVGDRLQRSVRHKLRDESRVLGSALARLDSVGPRSVLKRGYSFITTAGGRKLITSPDQVRPGQTLRVQSAGGEWRATPLPNEPELFDSADE